MITGGDQSENIDMGNDPFQERAVRVEIRAIVKTSKDLDDALEAICLKVEQAMASAVISDSRQGVGIWAQNIVKTRWAISRWRIKNILRI